jgi:hypothetical protein
MLQNQKDSIQKDYKYSLIFLNLKVSWMHDYS